MARLFRTLGNRRQIFARSLCGFGHMLGTIAHRDCAFVQGVRRAGHV